VNTNKDYTSIADLLTEDSFMAWWLKKDALHEQAWEKWMASKPANAALAREAEQLLAVLVNLETQPISIYQRNASFNRLLKKIAEEKKRTISC